MFDFLPNFVENLLLAFLLFCGITVAVGLVAAYWVWRQFQNYTVPDVTKLDAQFHKLKSSQAKMSDTRAIQKIISQQAFKCGLVGAATSFGGFYTLPIALPIDILLSTQIQSTMVEFIAQRYGHSSTNAIENRVKTYMVTTGTVTLTERTSTFFLRYGMRLMEKTFPKFIPILGAVIGFAVNYFIARTTGNVALQWYSKNRKTGQNSPQLT